MKLITKEISVFIHIIGKTLEGNLNCTIIPRISVVTGGQDLSSIIIEKDVQMNTCVSTVTDGKNKNIILKITNLIHANTVMIATNRIVLIITMKGTEDNL